MLAGNLQPATFFWRLCQGRMSPLLESRAQRLSMENWVWGWVVPLFKWLLASASSHDGWLSQKPVETTEPLKAEFGVSRAFPLPHFPGENEGPCPLPPSTRSTNKPYFHESLQVTTGAAPRQQVMSNRRTSYFLGPPQSLPAP